MGIRLAPFATRNELLCRWLSCGVKSRIIDGKRFGEGCTHRRPMNDPHRTRFANSTRAFIAKTMYI